MNDAWHLLTGSGRLEVIKMWDETRSQNPVKLVDPFCILLMVRRSGSMNETIAGDIPKTTKLEAVAATIGILLDSLSDLFRPEDFSKISVGLVEYCTGTENSQSSELSNVRPFWKENQPATLDRLCELLDAANGFSLVHRAVLGPRITKIEILSLYLQAAIPLFPPGIMLKGSPAGGPHLTQTI
jgi:hypothetical protein